MTQRKSSRNSKKKKANVPVHKMYLVHFGEVAKSFTSTHNKIRTKLLPKHGFLDWCRYGAQSYFVIVNASAMAFDVATYFRNLLPRKRFLVMELNIDNDCSYNATMGKWLTNLKSTFGL